MREILFRGKRKDNGEYIEGLPFYDLSVGMKVKVFIIPFAEVPTGEDVGKKFSAVYGMQEVEEDSIERIVDGDAEKIESAKLESAKETTRKIMIELNRTRNIVRENYGISEQVGVDIAINRVDAFYKELTEGKVKL